MAEPQVADPLHDLVEVGVRALREGDRAGARSLFRAIARRNPDNLRVWLWLAATSETGPERRLALDHVLTLDPTNAIALKGLAALDAASAPPDPAAAPSTAELSRRRRGLQAIWVVLLIMLLIMAALLFSNPQAWSWARGRPAPPTPVLDQPAALGAVAAPSLQVAQSLPATVTAAPVPATPSPPPLAAQPLEPVAPGTFFERDGWRIGLLAGPQSVVLESIGGLAPSQGRFVVVLLTVANSGAEPRPLDPAQLLLIDAQGRAYAPQPAASALYLDSAGGRGLAGDLAFGEPIPNSGGNLSIPVAFDIPPDASDLLLVAQSAGARMAWRL